MPALRAPMTSPKGTGLALDGQFPGVGDNRSRQDADQGRLAGAVGADEAVDLTGANVEGDLAQCADAPEGFADAARRQKQAFGG